jgi:hypothetical protein
MTFGAIRLLIWDDFTAAPTVARLPCLEYHPLPTNRGHRKHRFSGIGLAAVPRAAERSEHGWELRVSGARLSPGRGKLRKI